MRASLFLISFALSSAACSGTADDPGQGAASQDESGAAAEGAAASAGPPLPATLQLITGSAPFAC